MLVKDRSSLYAVYKAKDARFDGRFFIGISSTGIYCRPVCRARQPKAENCNFFSTAAEAEQAGFRPCLLCRPELAPGSSVTDATSTLAHQARRLLEEACGSGETIEEIASRLGCTDRHLRRAFTAEYNVSPVHYLQTCRLLLAKNLLTDTDLPVIDVAMAAGFGSLRRFNDLFKNRYRLSPTALRKRMGKEKKQGVEITLTLGYRPPYQWEKILEILNRHAIPSVEFVTNKEYMRTVQFQHVKGNHVHGSVRIRHLPKKHALAVSINENLLLVLPQLLAKVRHLFDLYCDPQTIYDRLAPMNDIRPGLCVIGTRLPGSFHSFETAIGAILRQRQTTEMVKIQMASLANAVGTKIKTSIPGLTHAFPTPTAILDVEKPIEVIFKELHIDQESTKTILHLAKSLAHGEIDFNRRTEPEKELEKLMFIPGMEMSTAKYIAMRTMEWTDTFPHTDKIIKEKLEPYVINELRQEAEAWRPWRSYAAMNIWNF